MQVLSGPVFINLWCPHSPARVLLGSSYGQDIFKPLNHLESNKDHEKKMKLAFLEATMEGALRESSVASLLVKIPFAQVSKWPKSVAPTREHHAGTLGPLDHLWCALMVRYELCQRCDLPNSNVPSQCATMVLKEGRGSITMP